MGILSFYCPTTTRSIETPIRTEYGKLAGSWAKTMTVRCPHCGAEHELVLRDAFIVEQSAAELAAEQAVALAERMTNIAPLQKAAKAAR
jgi:hypothetical protein